MFRKMDAVIEHKDWDMTTVLREVSTKQGWVLLLFKYTLFIATSIYI